ncbi:MAG: C13 family peptidase [Gammaproteobacteria bacterium]
MNGGAVVPKSTRLVRRGAALALVAVGAFSAARAGDDDQALIEAQSDRVATAVARMAPQQPGVTDVYFIGFAGYGGQQVFRKEATFARDAFAQRYGNHGRSLLLINDERDRQSYPLATRTNLRHALRLLGARMDPAEDILLLVLTSHGSSKGGLEVSNGDLPLAMLRPSDLREALTHAGIRWRVVIASACFAGVFIPPLRDASTLIVTAADARHSSFGCEDDRELTWFGEAFLRDALPGAASLEDAFLAARRIVERRERAERAERSRPQMHVGRDIRQKLLALEASRPAARPGSAAQVN